MSIVKPCSIGCNSGDAQRKHRLKHPCVQMMYRLPGPKTFDLGQI